MMQNTVELVPFTEEVFAEYYQKLVSSFADSLLQSELFGSFPDAYHESQSISGKLLPDGLATQGQHLFQIRKANSNVGLLWYSETSPFRDASWLCDIFIEPEHRRNGYASTAVFMMETHLKTLGVSRVGLNVFSHNPSALKLYASLGYDVVKAVFKPHSSEVAKYHLMKIL